ncbi:hypothetical protein [Spirilliplanes yamanashiensis]|uniref:hypothetical protein n=1 Tax=Spirilliplanes yamanashiensis TaxID=42233 RepID=UPI00194E45DE|nr:hypothetical protein [Spirilliplanes yamanashiensis]MDP9814127.1 hypothetical protein [Spirilliplanes yamanashiensis]
MRPTAVRVLTVLLVLTAAATVTVELLNLRYADEQGFGLAVRTGWALLRTVGWLVLIWHVRKGRASARPLGLILAATTIFAVARLVLPREGLPPLPGLVGFGVLTALCVTVVVLLYRHPALLAWHVRHANRLVVTGEGLRWQEGRPSRPELSGWLLTARTAAFTWTPLMIVPALAAGGELGRNGVASLAAVVAWFAAAIAQSWFVAGTTLFLLRGKAWARTFLLGVGVAVLAVHLPLCWLLLGPDGLVRDGAPVVAAVLLAAYGLRRAGREPARDQVLVS